MFFFVFGTLFLGLRGLENTKHTFLCLAASQPSRHQKRYSFFGHEKLGKHTKWYFFVFGEASRPDESYQFERFALKSTWLLWTRLHTRSMMMHQWKICRRQQKLLRMKNVADFLGQKLNTSREHPCRSARISTCALLWKRLQLQVGMKCLAANKNLMPSARLPDMGTCCSNFEAPARARSCTMPVHVHEGSVPTPYASLPSLQILLAFFNSDLGSAFQIPIPGCSLAFQLLMFDRVLFLSRSLCELFA